MSVITGDDLRIARLMYGFESQEALGKEINVALGTIQRYEAMDEVDAKTLGIYKELLKFDVEGVRDTVKDFKKRRILALTL